MMEVGTRRIVHVNVTSHPTLPWVRQQIREATGWDESPRFLVHDNDAIFGQYGKRVTVARGDRTRSYRCHLDQWLGEVMGIEGLPIPYGAPNASPYVERFNRALRKDALDHFIFLSVDHIRRVVAEYIRYYNGARPSQAIHEIPDPYPELRQPPPPASAGWQALGSVESPRTRWFPPWRQRIIIQRDTGSQTVNGPPILLELGRTRENPAP
jgi:putative transposase